MPKNTKKKTSKDTKDPIKLKVQILLFHPQFLLIRLIGTWQQSVSKQELC